MTRPRQTDGDEDVIEGTRLESVEEVRESVSPRRTPTLRESSPADDTVAYRPTARPPMASLCILDDGRDDGEWVRLRGDRLVIGRNEGDVIIPHDSMMSGRHAELNRVLVKGRYRWHLLDLKSTNGTYVRVSHSPLQEGQEFLIGRTRLRFSTGAAAQVVPGPEQQGTRGLWVGELEKVLPMLVEVQPGGEGQRFVLQREEAWMGRDSAQSAVALESDPMVSPRHARVYRDAAGQWHLENAGSLNGVWLRVARLPIEGSARFQLGEQRFLVRIL